MSDAMFAVQDAVYDLLAADGTVQGALGDPARIYDHVPPEATFPFLTLGDTDAEIYDSKNLTGMTQVILLHAWSRYRGRKEIKDILQALYGALHNASLSVSGASFVSCRFESASLLIDDDGMTYHGLARYRVITEQT
ncbi:MAG: DUF3168 domain-containing protein [Alphaproteobacteria bacterium]|nr:DUF3168 domain-containing protein [Alphaproteobacteria bacterium]